MICRHSKYSDGHCAEWYCPLYSGKCPKHAPSGNPTDRCSLEVGEDEHLEADYEDRSPDVDLEDEDEDYEKDPDVEFRKQVLNEVMERHPDMAFTGNSVQDYIYSDGELESAGMEDPYRGEY